MKKSCVNGCERVNGRYWGRCKQPCVLVSDKDHEFCRCQVHQAEVERKRARRHTDPLVQKVAEVNPFDREINALRNLTASDIKLMSKPAGGFTHATGPSRIKPVTFADMKYERRKFVNEEYWKSEEKRVSSPEHVLAATKVEAAESNLRKAALAHMHEKKGVPCPGCEYEKMQMPEAKAAAERLFAATPKEFGESAVSAYKNLQKARVPIPDEKLIDDLIIKLKTDSLMALKWEDRKNQGDTEMAVRGLKIRSQRLAQIEDRNYANVLEGLLKKGKAEHNADVNTMSREIQRLNGIISDLQASTGDLERLRAEIQKRDKEDEVAEVWKTKEGKNLKPIDMRDGHLMNAIRYAERNATAHVSVFDMNDAVDYGEYDGEGSIVPTGSGTDVVRDMFPSYPRLLEEARRRGLLKARGRTLFNIGHECLKTEFHKSNPEKVKYSVTVGRHQGIPITQKVYNAINERIKNYGGITYEVSIVGDES